MELRISLEPTAAALTGGIGKAKSVSRKSFDVRVGPVLFTIMAQGRWRDDETHVGFGLYLLLLDTWSGKAERIGWKNN